MGGDYRQNWLLDRKRLFSSRRGAFYREVVHILREWWWFCNVGGGIYFLLRGGAFHREVVVRI